MDTPDLPRPDFIKEEGKVLREQVDELIRQAKGKNPNVKSLSYVQDFPNDPKKEQRVEWTIFPPSNLMSHESAEELSWTKADFQRSVLIQPAESILFPNWYKDERGQVYQGTVQYYLNEDGQLIKQGFYRSVGSDELAKYQARGAYHPEAPLPPVPTEVRDNVQYIPIFAPLDPGDYERIGAALRQIKSGKWPIINKY